MGKSWYRWMGLCANRTWRDNGWPGNKTLHEAYHQPLQGMIIIEALVWAVRRVSDK